MNNFAVLQALAFEPRKAFAELDALPRFWWPLLVVAIASAVVNYWYTAAVDLEWLADIQLRANPLTQNMTSDELARTRAHLADTERTLADREASLAHERRRLDKIFASALWRLGRPWRALFGPKI